MIFGNHEEKVGSTWALTILALTGLSCFFAGLSLGLYLTRPGGSLPTTLEGRVDTPTTEPTMEVTPEPANTAFLVSIPAPTPIPGRIHAQVVKVIAGDTVEARCYRICGQMYGQ